jgi:hypothetical protein
MNEQTNGQTKGPTRPTTGPLYTALKIHQSDTHHGDGLEEGFEGVLGVLSRQEEKALVAYGLQGLHFLPVGPWDCVRVCVSASDVCLSAAGVWGVGGKSMV